MKPPVADSALVVALLAQVPVLTDRIVAEAESYRKAAAVSPEDLRLGQPGEVLAARACRDNLVEMLAYPTALDKAGRGSDRSCLRPRAAESLPISYFHTYLGSTPDMVP